MKKLLATVALAATLISGAAKADDGFAVIGPGTMPCSQFNILSRQPGLSGQVADNGFYFWAQGFMSAVNLAKGANGQPIKSLSSIDIDDQRVILREYCKAHPTKNYIDGVIQLENQLDDSATQ